MQNNNMVWVAIVLGIILIGGAAYLFMVDPAVVAPANETASTTQSGGTDATSTPTGSGSTGGTTATSYTAAQVTDHSSASSCWTIIDGNVYDVTAWIGQHPGGRQAILQLCGKDGTALFHGQHGNAAQQANILASMKIGALAR